MKKTKKSPDDLTRSIAGQLFPARLTRAELRKLKIIGGAIRTYAELGIEYVSHEDIAKNSGTSRPLVIHHFPDKHKLFETAMKLIRAQMQEVAIRRIVAATGPRAQLVAYIESTFDWVRLYPTHAKAWIFFFYVCASDAALKREHRELTEMGRQRILALLKAGVKQGQFQNRDLPSRAKQIQQLITGALLEFETELEMADLDRVRRDCVKACLALVEH